MIEMPPGLPEQVHAVADALFGRPKRPIADLVRATSALYTRERDQLEGPSKRDVLQARLRFYFLRDLLKITFPLAELHAAERLPQERTWRLLDLGAGFGTTSLGASLYAAELDAADRFVVDAFDFSGPALEGFRRLSDLGLPMELRTFTEDIRRFEDRLSEERYDLIVLGLVLNELTDDDAIALMQRLRARLSPGGAIVVLEPALREVTRTLMALRDRLASEGWPIFAPCPHRGACPMRERPKDWCHEERALVFPDSLAAIAKEAGLRSRKSTFAYLTIAEGPSLVDAVLEGEGRRRIVSSRLASKGKLELVGCGDDGSLVKLMRLNRHADDSNEGFGDARRGDLLRHRGARPGRVGAGEAVVRWSLGSTEDD